MKVKLFTYYLFFLVFLSCNDLNIERLDQSKTTEWFTTEYEFRLAVNEGYKQIFWPRDDEFWTDNETKRNYSNVIKDGTVDSQWWVSGNYWANCYTGIRRMNEVASQLELQDFLSESKKNQFLAEVNYCRASMFSYLITHFGDVPFYEQNPDVDQVFNIERTNKWEILEKIYAYYNQAVKYLPKSYDDEIRYATKGAVYAMKARVALYMGQMDSVIVATTNCMELKTYELHDTYGELFLSKTINSKEMIFSLPRSTDLDQDFSTRDYLPRNASGWAVKSPSWELLASYECIDGKEVDESLNFDPRNPFMDRDPRLWATIVPFGKLTSSDTLKNSSASVHLGVEYNPYPMALDVYDYNNSKLILNNDNRANIEWASFNGLLWKKGIDKTWADDLRSDNDHTIMRYADVLLMYAEAKIELNQIDDSVLRAINQVRERAYRGTEINYPEVTTKQQNELRKIVRRERRVEFAMEGLRYMDLVRWKLAEKALTGNVYGLLDVSKEESVVGELIDKVVKPNKWFWAMAPKIDEDGIVNFQQIYEAGLCKKLNSMSFTTHQYLFPIPDKDRKLNPKLTQNVGY
jgi:hypothetical protein